jgi:hypothetical protein
MSGIKSYKKYKKICDDAKARGTCRDLMEGLSLSELRDYLEEYRSIYIKHKKCYDLRLKHKNKFYSNNSDEGHNFQIENELKISQHCKNLISDVITIIKKEADLLEQRKIALKEEQKAIEIREKELQKLAISTRKLETEKIKFKENKQEEIGIIISEVLEKDKLNRNELLKTIFEKCINVIAYLYLKIINKSNSTYEQILKLPVNFVVTQIAKYHNKYKCSDFKEFFDKFIAILVMNTYIIFSENDKKTRIVIEKVNKMYANNISPDFILDTIHVNPNVTDCIVKFMIYITYLSISITSNFNNRTIEEDLKDPEILVSTIHEIFKNISIYEPIFKVINTDSKMVKNAIYIAETVMGLRKA